MDRESAARRVRGENGCVGGDGGGGHQDGNARALQNLRQHGLHGWVGDDMRIAPDSAERRNGR